MSDWFAAILPLHRSVTSQESFDASFAHIDTEMDRPKEIYALATEHLAGDDPPAARAAAFHVLGELG